MASVSVKDSPYLAKGNARAFTGSTSGSTLTASAATFSSSDVGLAVAITGGAGANLVFFTTIASYTSSTSVTLTAAPTVAVTSVPCLVGNDDTSAINSAVSAASASGTTAGSVFFPTGTYFTNSQIAIPQNITVYGEGRSSSTLTYFGLNIKSFCVVHDLGFIGNLQTNFGSGNIGPFAVNTSVSASQTDWVIENCKVFTYGTGIYLDKTSDGLSQPYRGRVSGNVFSGNGSAVIAVRPYQCVFDRNEIDTTQAPAHGIFFYGGYQNRVTGNRLTGGTTGINCIYNRASSGALGVFTDNVIADNVISGVTEESISLDVRGSDVNGTAACEFDTVSAKSSTGPPYTITLANSNWSGAGSPYVGYYVCFVSGLNAGQTAKITAQSDAVFTLNLTAAQWGNVSTTDTVSIGAPFLRNTISGNVIDARNSTTYGIHLYGLCFSNAVTGNSSIGPGSLGAGTGTAQVMGGGIGCRSKSGLVIATGSRTNTQGVAPSMNNTFTGNTVVSADMYADFNPSGSTNYYYSVGNTFQANTVMDGTIRLDRNQQIFGGNSLSALPVVTEDSPIPAVLPAYTTSNLTEPVAALTYSSSITPNATGTYQVLKVTNTTAFTIANPTTAAIGMSLTFDITNSSGGAMGTITWGSLFKLAGAFTNPSSGKRRTIVFYFDGTNWVETGRASADI